MDELQKAIGEHLKEHALSRGTVSELCEHSGVSRSTVDRLFNGHGASTENLLRVLKAIGRWDVIDALVTPKRQTPTERVSGLLTRTRHHSLSAKPLRPQAYVAHTRTSSPKTDQQQTHKQSDHKDS